MIKVCGISKCFGKKLALDNVSFRLDSGQVVALIGENGAGNLL
jgi:ABC-type multidrug transport system ATPase subunit